MKKLFLFVIPFVLFFSTNSYSNQAKLLCIPNEQSYELKGFDDWIVKNDGHQEDDLIITIYENKLLRNYDNGDVEYTRVKTKADNYKNTFTMRYDHKKYPKENYFVFHRKSGRLENVRRVNNHQRLFLYNCSIFKGPIF